MQIKDKIEYSVNIIENLGRFFQTAPPETKILLLSSIFPEKIEFDGKNYRTKSYNRLLDVIYMETNQLRDNNGTESPENSGDSVCVAPGELFSNSFLEDLDKIWALRSVIPDPKHPNSIKDI